MQDPLLSYFKRNSIPNKSVYEIYLNAVNLYFIPLYLLKPKFSLSRYSSCQPTNRPVLRGCGGHCVIASTCLCFFLQTNRYVICQICESYHNSIEELNAHYERDHPTGSKLERKNKCEFCDRSYSQISHLYFHQRKKHGRETGNREPKPPHPSLISDGKYKCEFCDKSYVKTSHLYSHQRKVHGRETASKRQYAQGTVPCDVCGNWFSTKYNLYIHKQRKHKN